MLIQSLIRHKDEQENGALVVSRYGSTKTFQISHNHLFLPTNNVCPKRVNLAKYLYYRPIWITKVLICYGNLLRRTGCFDDRASTYSIFIIFIMMIKTRTTCNRSFRATSWRRRTSAAPKSSSSCNVVIYQLLIASFSHRKYKTENINHLLRCFDSCNSLKGYYDPVLFHYGLRAPPDTLL